MSFIRIRPFPSLASPRRPIQKNRPRRRAPRPSVRRSVPAVARRPVLVSLSRPFPPDKRGRAASRSSTDNSFNTTSVQMSVPRQQTYVPTYLRISEIKKIKTRNRHPITICQYYAWLNRVGLFFEMSEMNDGKKKKNAMIKKPAFGHLSRAFDFRAAQTSRKTVDDIQKRRFCGRTEKS